MKLNIKNIGKNAEASIEINTITIILVKMIQEKVLLVKLYFRYFILFMTIRTMCFTKKTNI